MPKRTANTPTDGAIKKVRAKSAYSFFVADFRKSKPDLKFGDVTKEAASAWATCADKTVFEAQAKAFNDARAPVDAKTKRPPSAYILFACDYRSKLKHEQPELSFKELSQMCGSKWKSMLEEERQGWQLKHNETAATAGDAGQDIGNDDLPDAK